jgi:hypothetical protein
MFRRSTSPAPANFSARTTSERRCPAAGRKTRRKIWGRWTAGRARRGSTHFGKRTSSPHDSIGAAAWESERWHRKLDNSRCMFDVDAVTRSKRRLTEGQAPFSPAGPRQDRAAPGRLRVDADCCRCTQADREGVRHETSTLRPDSRGVAAVRRRLRGLSAVVAGGDRGVPAGENPIVEPRRVTVAGVPASLVSVGVGEAGPACAWRG